MAQVEDETILVVYEKKKKLCIYIYIYRLIPSKNTRKILLLFVDVGFEPSSWLRAVVKNL